MPGVALGAGDTAENKCLFSRPYVPAEEADVNG